MNQNPSLNHQPAILLILRGDREEKSSSPPVSVHSVLSRSKHRSLSGAVRSGWTNPVISMGVSRLYFLQISSTILNLLLSPWRAGPVAVAVVASQVARWSRWMIQRPGSITVAQFLSRSRSAVTSLALPVLPGHPLNTQQ